MGCYRNDESCFVWIGVTAVTNLAALPSIRMLFRQGLYYEGVLSIFTMVTSFLYHFADSIDRSIWGMSAGQWHRLDNIGSIGMFGAWLIYLMGLPGTRTSDDHGFRALGSGSGPPWHAIANYGFLMVVLVLQEKSPWDNRYTFGPLGALLCLLVVRVVCTGGRLMRERWHLQRLGVGVGLLGIGLFAFVKGLDDDKDTYRLFHGLWHMMVSISALFLWRTMAPATTSRRKLASPV